VALLIADIARVDFDHLQWDATIEDPNVFAKPWTLSRVFPLRGDLEKVDEYVRKQPRLQGFVWKVISSGSGRIRAAA
jgi:hypothetical protein